MVSRRRGECGLKSGTNVIHGSVYAFGRNNSLEAYNPYQNGITPALPKADDNFVQYGASMGGPIKKDKVFYFANYEGMRYTVGSPSLINTPTTSLNAQTPDHSLPLAINGLLANGVSLNLAGCTISSGAASCNPAKGVFPNCSTITENIPVALDNIGTSNNVIGKIGVMRLPGADLPATQLQAARARGPQRSGTSVHRCCQRRGGECRDECASSGLL